MASGVSHSVIAMRTRRVPPGRSGYTRSRKFSPAVCSSKAGSTPRRTTSSKTSRPRALGTGTAARIEPSAMSSEKPATVWPARSGNCSSPSSTRAFGFASVRSKTAWTRLPSTNTSTPACANRIGCSPLATCTSAGSGGGVDPCAHACAIARQSPANAIRLACCISPSRFISMRVERVARRNGVNVGVPCPPTTTIPPPRSQAQATKKSLRRRPWCAGARPRTGTLPRPPTR